MNELEPRSRGKSPVREAIETIVFTLLIYFIIRTFLFENYRVVGHSMDPTLADGQFVVVNKLLYRLQDPQRGDIIVFRERGDDDRKLIKRIVGLPGEMIEIRNGQVYINERLVNEPYVQNQARRSYARTVIPEDHYFVMGDNRSNSSDSRNWGSLPRSKIVGKGWLTYWPPELWGLIPHATYGEDGP